MEGKEGRKQEVDVIEEWKWWWEMRQLGCFLVVRVFWVVECVVGSDCVVGSGWRQCVLGILNVELEVGWGSGVFLVDYIFKYICEGGGCLEF